MFGDNIGQLLLILHNRVRQQPVRTAHDAGGGFGPGAVNFAFLFGGQDTGAGIQHRRTYAQSGNQIVGVIINRCPDGACRKSENAHIKDGFTGRDVVGSIAIAFPGDQRGSKGKAALLRVQISKNNIPGFGWLLGPYTAQFAFPQSFFFANANII
ncbi:hypothetical protein [uncultured Thalassospira sp.]|uniref:hypothetical protein n=1 Tax=uncultured Thalassospira sp. TaxID=404382 RepID=UPI0030D9DFB0